MAHHQSKEFQRRLQRVEKIHRRGGGFEAAGTLGRSAYHKKESRSLFRPLLFTLAIGLALKAALLMQIGEVDYRERVDRLAQGGQVEKVGAYVMQADPITLWLAQNMKEIFKAPA